MSDIDYGALGQAIDTTWGRSSSPLVNSFSVKMKLIGSDVLALTYQTTISFPSEKQMLQAKLREKNLSSENIKAVVDAVKKNYKDIVDERKKMGITSENVKGTLTLKEDKSDDSLEIIGLAVHNPKKTALYRKFVYFHIG